MTFRLGVDVGGTFTDLLLVDDSSGQTYTAKVPSTPEDSSIGVLDGINRICSQSDIDLSEVAQVMHGTTVATNAVLTGKGAKVGLITKQSVAKCLPRHPKQKTLALMQKRWQMPQVPDQDPVTEVTDD